MSNNFKRLFKMLIKNGWILDRIKGSHYIFEKDNQSVVVPRHNKDISIGVYNNVLKQTGLK
jgi:predicted RNA binding protein YcfA (HicA-like mRNA interferase family)